MPINNSKEARTSGTKSLKSVVVLILAMIAIFIVFHLMTGGNFLTAQNMKLVLAHCAIPSLTALGICFLFTTGYTDLSVGAMIALTSNFAGEVALKFGYAGMVVTAIALSFILIMINIQVATLLKLPSWISGIGMAMVYEALMGYYSNFKVQNGTTVVSLGKSFRELGAMPWIFIVAFVGVVLAWLIFTRTRAGISIRALGSNSAVAKMMGINERQAMLFTAVIAAIFIGLASAVNMSYSGKQLASSGLGSIALIFEPLAILLLARAFEKRIALPVGIFLCSLLIAGLFNALTWLGVPSGTGQEVIMGLGVVICAILAVRGTKGVVK